MGRSPWEPVSLDASRVLWRRALIKQPSRQLKPANASEAQPWAVNAAKGTAYDVASVQGMIYHGIKEATGAEPKIHECKTAAQPIVQLWRANGCKDPREFFTEWRMVCRAARESRVGLFARDIRGEDDAKLVDRSRSIATLARQDRWFDRLVAARAWVKRELEDKTHDAGRQTLSEAAKKEEDEWL